MSTAEMTVNAGSEAGDRKARLACVGAVAVAVASFLMSGLTGDSGAEVTAGLIADTNLLIGATYLAVFGSAGLMLAAVRLGGAVGPRHRVLVTAAGCAVAVMFAAYYASLGAAAIVATQSLAEPGPGLGEGALLVLNVMEITRYAPGLVLVAAALAARRHLPRPVWIAAAVLVVLTVAPFTSWIAALLIPVWLGVSGAVLPRRAG